MFVMVKKLHPLHQCAKKQLRLLILGDEDRNRGQVFVEVDEHKEEEEETIDCRVIGYVGLTSDGGDKA